MNRLVNIYSIYTSRTINFVVRNVSTTNICHGPKVQPFKVDKSFVEQDAEKLCKYVCINYFTEVKEPGPEIKENSEYPSWLFELDLSPPKELEDMDPKVDGWLYYKVLMRRVHEQNRRIRKLKTRFLHIQNSPSLKNMDGGTKKPKFFRKTYPDNR